MVRRGTEIALSRVENFKGGTGALLSREILAPDEMGGHGRKFGFTTLEPGASIGTRAIPRPIISSKARRATTTTARGSTSQKAT